MAFKILFCGTPQFAVPSLEALHHDPRFEIVSVFSQPDRPSGRGQKLQPSPVKKKALELGLTVEAPEKASAKEVVQSVQDKGLDAAVVVAYGQILSQAFLDSFKEGCVNIHSSLLPRWRGAAPIQRALMSGDNISGVSLQKVVKKLDAGPIIAAKGLPLTAEIGALELTEKLSDLGGELLLQSLEAFLKGEGNLKTQDESLVSYAAKIEKAEGRLDWKQSASSVHNKIRGLNMGGPFAYTTFHDRNLKIHKSYPSSLKEVGPPGQVVQIEKDHFVVACGEGALELWVVQPESKARMNAADFIRGYHLKKGDCFV